MSFTELYQQAVNYSDAEKINIGRNSCAIIANYFKGAGLSNDDFCAFVLNLVAVFAGADNLVSRKEHDLFMTITGLNVSYDQFYDLVNNGDNANARAAVDNLVDQVGGDFKDACLMFGLAFLTIDDKVTPEEKAFFERIWG